MKDRVFMSDTGLEQQEPGVTTGRDPTENEPGELRTMETTTPDTAVASVPSAAPLPMQPKPQRRQDQAATIEHLAARRAVPPLSADAPEVKYRLSILRTDITRLVTGLRWGGVSIEDTTEQLIPLLDVGPLQQWAPVLVPYLLEIDRAGNLIPVWLKVIEQEDPTDLPPDANPAETMIGRARRIAILMLSNYKSTHLYNLSTPRGFSKKNQALAQYKSKVLELSDILGKLAINPGTSLYATQALVKQSTSDALQALIRALKDAEGWAKVDIVEACLKFNQPSLQELLLASGLDRAAGLESYIAIPLFRSISLERYLRSGQDIAPRLSDQAAMILSQVLHDSLNTSGTGNDALPLIFERDLPPLAYALFDGARNAPTWQKVIALHRLGLLVGRYWGSVSTGTIRDPRIAQPVYACGPMMPEVERWMSGPGRDVLLQELKEAESEGFLPSVRVLGEMREPRAASELLTQLEATNQITDRESAIHLGHICDALGRIGDRRAVNPMLQLLSRSVNVGERAARPKRRDNLPLGDADIPRSIVYAAVVRALGRLGDRSTLDTIIRAASDFDPYVRTQALEALKAIDPTGDDMRSRMVVREALNDLRDSVAGIACQIITQYHDLEAIPLLNRLAETRPAFAASVSEALLQLR